MYLQAKKNLQFRGYKYDIVFVIDSTGSMSPFIEQIKNRVFELDNQIIEALEMSGKSIEQLRMRVIDYADYLTEGDEAVRLTDFFTMPQDKQAFVNAVNNIDCKDRGIRAPLSNGLEALYAAMTSDWTEVIPHKDKGRHIIVLATDNYPLHLMERKKCDGYPADELPPDIAELQNVWNNDDFDYSLLSKRDKRLILLAPEGDDGKGHSWIDMQAWENTVFTVVDHAKGLNNIPFDAIIAEIVRSC